MRTEVGQRNNIARQRSAGERTAGAEIGARPNARFALESQGNFLRVGAHVFAEARDLVDEGNGHGEKRIERVLHHFRGFGAHE